MAPLWQRHRKRPVLDNQNPINAKAIPRLVIIGTSIGIGAILLFGGLWLGLGRLGVEPLIRLAVSVCVPPAAMTIAAVLLFWRQQEKLNESATND